MPFQAFLERYEGEVSVVQDLLSEPLPDDCVALSTSLREIEAHRGRISTLLAYANAFLDGAEAEAWPKTLGEGTRASVEERKIVCAQLVKDERRFRDHVEGLVESIDRRIKLGCDLLWHARREKEQTGRTQV